MVSTASAIIQNRHILLPSTVKARTYKQRPFNQRAIDNNTSGVLRPLEENYVILLGDLVVGGIYQIIVINLIRNLSV